MSSLESMRGRLESLHSFSGKAVSFWAVTFVFGWFLLDGFVLAPSFGGTDIYFFKDSSVNFAEGLGLVSRFTFGNPSFDYQSYTQYPPLYPLAFGIFVKLFGVSALTNQVFNTLISMLVGVAGFVALRPLFARTRFEPLVLALIFAGVVATGFYFPERDRPDGLGILLGFLAIIVLNRGAARQNELMAGALCAVALFTSPFAGLWSSIAVGCIVFARQYSKQGLGGAVAGLFFVGAGGVLGLILGASLVVVFLPGWFSAFLGVLTGSTTNNETGGGYFLALLKGDVKTWLSAFPITLPSYFVDLAKLLAAQIVLIGALIVDRLRSGARWQGLPILALVAASPLCLITTPYQGNYPSMTAALLIVAAASMSIAMAPVSHRFYAMAIVIGVGLIAVLSFPFVVRDGVIRAGTRPSMERALDFMDRNRASFDRPDRYLGVPSATYILWRQAGIRPVLSIYSGFDDPEKRKKLAYVALGYPGSSDPLSPQKPAWLTEADWRLEHKPDLPQLATFLGWAASRSSQTWESALFAKRDGTQP